MVLFFQPLLLTLKVSVISTVLLLFVATYPAYLFARRTRFSLGLVESLLLLPLFFPPTVLGYYLLALFGRSSFIGRLLEETLGVQIAFTWLGCVIASFFAALPVFIIVARVAFERVEKRVEELALLHGKTPIQVFFYVTVPLAKRGLVAAALLAFARSAGEFGATLILAGNIPGKTQTASIAIYDAVSFGGLSEALPLVLVMTAVSIAILWITTAFSVRGRNV